MTKDDLRGAILAADDLPREVVDVPWELGGQKLYVRGLTADEKDEFVATSTSDGDFQWKRGFTALLVCRTLVDEDGARIFDDADAPSLGAKSGRVLSDLYDVAARLSGLVAEEIEQGFETGQSERSTTG
jgi:hypothetical protein